MTSPATLKLTSNLLTLELAPHAGGSIATFRLLKNDQAIDLMRPASEQALEQANARATACFPLVPFSNRIENGEFEYDGKQVRLPLNFAPHPHPLHGQGFQRPWQLIEHTATSAAIVYEHAGNENGWPWIYRAEQRFTLSGDTLIASISLQNTGPETMPAGIGFHPFFPRTTGVQLNIGLGQVWIPDDNNMPKTLSVIPDEWRFINNRSLQSVVLDHCFTDWDGLARIYWPEHKTGLEITHSGLLKHMVIYVPDNEDFFCIEPVSHVNNAIKLAANGVENTGQLDLPPGETVYAEVRYKVIT